MLNWDPSKGKLVDYPEKSKKLFKKTNIFNLKHWIIPVNDSFHWSVVFISNMSQIVEWGRNNPNEFNVQVCCSLRLKNKEALEKIAGVINKEY